MDPGVGVYTGGGVVRGTCSPRPLQECMHNISAIIIACMSQKMFKLYRASELSPTTPYLVWDAILHPPKPRADAEIFCEGEQRGGAYNNQALGVAN